MPATTKFLSGFPEAGAPLARHLSPGGLASPAPVRAKHYTPCEASAELEAGGLKRSARWVADECHAGRIATNPAFRGRHYIPESEILRLLGLKSEAAK